MDSLPPRWPQLAHFYRTLGLRPLDEFMQEAVARNRARRIDTGFMAEPGSQTIVDRDFRQMGTTTWMIVRAALALQEGCVTIRVTKETEADDLGKMALPLIRRTIGGSCIGLSNGRGMRFGGNVFMIATKDSQVLPTGPCIHADEWFERARARVLGDPYKMTKYVRVDSDGVARAYAEEEEALFDLSEEGLQSVISGGWKIPLRENRPWPTLPPVEVEFDHAKELRDLGEHFMDPSWVTHPAAAQSAAASWATHTPTTTNVAKPLTKLAEAEIRIRLPIGYRDSMKNRTWNGQRWVTDQEAVLSPQPYLPMDPDPMAEAREQLLQDVGPLPYPYLFPGKIKG